MYYSATPTATVFLFLYCVCFRVLYCSLPLSVIQLSIPVELFNTSHVRFEFRHCSSKFRQLLLSLFYSFITIGNNRKVYRWPPPLRMKHWAAPCLYADQGREGKYRLQVTKQIPWSLTFNIMGTQSVKDHTLITALRQCWTASRCHILRFGNKSKESTDKFTVIIKGDVIHILR